MSERTKVFADCGRVLLRVYEGSCEDVKHSTDVVTEARACTFVIMHEIIDAIDKKISAPVVASVQTALSGVHTDINYQVIPEKLIRDLGEICVTFRSVELGIDRSFRERVLEAKLFCMLLSYELGDLKIQ